MRQKTGPTRPDLVRFKNRAITFVRSEENGVRALDYKRRIMSVTEVDILAPLPVIAMMRRNAAVC